MIRASAMRQIRVELVDGRVELHFGREGDVRRGRRDLQIEHAGGDRRHLQRSGTAQVGRPDLRRRLAKLLAGGHRDVQQTKAVGGRGELQRVGVFQIANQQTVLLGLQVQHVNLGAALVLWQVVAPHDIRHGVAVRTRQTLPSRVSCHRRSGVKRSPAYNSGWQTDPTRRLIRILRIIVNSGRRGSIGPALHCSSCRWPGRHPTPLRIFQRVFPSSWPSPWALAGRGWGEGFFVLRKATHQVLNSVGRHPFTGLGVPAASANARHAAHSRGASRICTRSNMAPCPSATTANRPSSMSNGCTRTWPPSCRT